MLAGYCSLLEINDLFVCLVYYCPYCLPPLSGEQVGNKKRDRQTNRALISRREQKSAAKNEKLLSLLMRGVTFQYF